MIDTTNESTTESSLAPAKKRLRTNRTIEKNKKIDLVDKTKESRSIIKELPGFMAIQFKNFLQTLRLVKSQIKIYLKRKKSMNYIMLSKINKISLLKFVFLVFSSRNKIKNSLNDQNMSDIIRFCKQLPRVAKACLGEGISKLL